MAWNNYVPGESGIRTIPLSKELYKAVIKYHEDKKCTIQHIVDVAVIILWRTYNGGTETNEPANHVAERKVRNIVENNYPPGKKQNYKRIAVQFKGEKTFEWITKVEKLYMCDGVCDFVRRSVSYYLRMKGYIDDSIAKEIQEKQAQEK